MHRATRLSVLAVGIAGAAGGLTVTSMTTASSSKSDAKASKKQIICRARMAAVVAPETNTENYGTVSCTGVAFGEGIQHDIARLTRPSETTATIAGRFRIYFDAGTLRGTYKADVTVADEIATYKGTTKVTSGTGTLQGTTGTGTIDGTSRDGVHATLTERFKLTVRETRD